MTGKHKGFRGALLIAVVLAIAAYVTFWDPAHQGLELDVDQRSTPARARVPHDMQSLKALYRTINLVQKHYIDASRIDAREMFIAATRAVQREVANVLVREQGEQLFIRFNTEERQFALDELTTPWVLLQRIKDVFDFLRSNFKEDKKRFIELEYSVINGMLQTLDPHSVFLTPEMYRNMKDKTQGKFGGLGIVISIRDGALTVISPIDGTPADIAGLKSGDKIVKIDDVSTVSMALNDAVTLLRGDPGTTVAVEVVRKGWEEPIAFQIIRAIIEVRSIESQLLSKKIGYIRIKDFQGNTAKDLNKHLAELERKNIRGLVLDLRNNPGGLLDAAIRVSDRFLKRGVIVTTAGQGPAERDIRRARDDNNEPDYPIVLLVNAGSASASEIVAGALKNHNRALVVGQRTFGKGSVQVLYERGFANNSALKLTTAQYLTPGDISIQSVGVTPHVESLPMRADEERLDLVVEPRYRESDLDHHFESARLSAAAKRPATTLNYLWTPTPKPATSGTGQSPNPAAPTPTPAPPPAAAGAADQSFKPDFEIDFARDLVLEMAQSGQSNVDAASLVSLIKERTNIEERRLAKALKKLGIDWSVQPDDRTVDVSVIAKLVDPKPLEPGKPHRISMAVTNRGPGTVYRLHSTTRCDFRPLDERELAFGRIEPGQTITRELKFKVPKDALSRVDDVRFSFTEANSRPVTSTALRFQVEALPRPRFAYGFQMVDQKGGNGDGGLQPGESVEFIVDVENVGEGASLESYASLKSLSGKELFMVRGRESFGKFEPGKRHQIVFSFDVKPEFTESLAKLELAIADVDLRVYAVEKITIPITPAQRVEPHTATVAPQEKRAALRQAPRDDAPIVAYLSDTGSVDGRIGEFYRVRIDEHRIGWIDRREVTANQAAEANPSLDFVLNAPPRLSIDETEQVVRSDTITLKGRVSDDKNVRDVYIFVDEQKVFFKSNTDATDPTEVTFEAELPLKHGVNYVMIVAEETSDLDAREIIAIRRDRPDGMAFFSPKFPNGEPEPIGIPSITSPSMANRVPLRPSTPQGVAQ